MKKQLVKGILLLGALVGLTTCSPSAHEKRVKSLQTIQSWTATAQRVGEAWQQSTVPDAYAEQTLAKSQAEIARETPNLSDPSARQVQQIQQTLQQLTAAVKQDQKAAIAAPLQQLLPQRQQLDTLLAQEKQL